MSEALLEHAEATGKSSKINASLAGKYLTFCLGQEYYGIAVLKIREIIRLLEITPVPQMPDFIRGVINLRGKIIPVIDLRMRFHLAKADTNERTCIVVVQVELPNGDKTQMGMVVDAVEEVINIALTDMEETPNFGAKLQSHYILGMAKIKGKVKTLLDIDKVVGADALAEVAAATA
ncbi:purine-binding chemotaxis protein CheW [Verrucomicrobium sp. GAS474]|uniref:chemotaxis protein CheW n=1 Tax=Verrucomicrobium sp. GAS474 TaxID=1882831 RepID=UPI00087A9DCB|nr:chemotaxis protein CheW [Verrucomicrobium sp. GAS474]SDU01156.1 purine-binding chemotaxis protein CheW [Verrucomicrobium sp. GAS474]